MTRALDGGHDAPPAPRHVDRSELASLLSAARLPTIHTRAITEGEQCCLALLAFETSRYSDQKQFLRTLQKMDSSQFHPLSSALKKIEARCREFDCEPLVPICEAASRLCPIDITLDDRGRNRPEDVAAFDALFCEMIRHGASLPMSSYHPEIEGWLKGCASELTSIVRGELDIERCAPEQVGRALIGTTLAASSFTSRVYRHFHPNEMVASYVGAICEAVRAGLATSMINAFDLPAERWKEVERFTTGLKSLKVKDYAIVEQYRDSRFGCALRDAPGAVSLVNLALDTRRMVSEAVETGLMIDEALKDSGLCVPSSRDPIFPLGHLNVILEDASRGVLYYVLDGVGRMEAVGIATDAQRSLAGFTLGLRDEGTYHMGPANWARIDESGRFIGRLVCRLAEPAELPGLDAARSGVGAFAEEMNQRVVLLWEEYPDLFNELKNLGPVTFVVRPNEHLILCLEREASVVGAQIAHCGATRERVDEILPGLGIRPHQPWVGFRIDLPASDDVPQAEPEPSPSEQDLRREIRAVLNRTGALDGRELQSLLGGFSVREVPGKGDHKHLVRAVGDHEVGYTVDDKWMRPTVCIRDHHLWPLLDTLEIPLDHFLHRLLRARHFHTAS